MLKHQTMGRFGRRKGAEQSLPSKALPSKDSAQRAGASRAAEPLVNPSAPTLPAREQAGPPPEDSRPAREPARPTQDTRVTVHPAPEDRDPFVALPVQDSAGRLRQDESGLSPGCRPHSSSSLSPPSLAVPEPPAAKVDGAKGPAEREARMAQGREAERLRKALSSAHQKNDKLSKATQSLVEEVSSLRSRLEESTSPEAEELGELLGLVVAEMTGLGRHLADERGNWARIKAAQAAELSAGELERASLEDRLRGASASLAKGQAERCRLQARVEVLETELSSVVPVWRHREAVERAETLLKDLRDAYARASAERCVREREASAELRRLGRALAASEAAARRTATELDAQRRERHRAQEAAAELGLQLAEARGAKAAAEEELARLLHTIDRAQPKA